MTDAISTQSSARTEARQGATRTPTQGLRAAATAGVAFVVLELVATFITGVPPASNASAAKVAAYFHDHAGALRAQLLIGGLGIAALWWWFSGLWHMWRTADDERPGLPVTAAIGLASGGALVLVATAFTATAAIRPIDVATAHLLYSLSLVTIAAAGFGVAVFLIAACTLTDRAASAPRWTSYLGYVAAVVFLFGTLGVVSDASVYTNGATLAFLLWCVWIVVMSALMWRAAAD